MYMGNRTVKGSVTWFSCYIKVHSLIYLFISYNFTNEECYTCWNVTLCRLNRGMTDFYRLNRTGWYGAAPEGRRHPQREAQSWCFIISFQLCPSMPQCVHDAVGIWAVCKAQCSQINWTKRIYKQYIWYA